MAYDKAAPLIKKTKLTFENPTLTSLKEQVSDSSPDELFAKYSPFMVNKQETSAKEAFRKTVNLLTNFTQINMLATDNSFICTGDEYKHITKFKSSHREWPLNESLVTFSYRTINAAEERELRAFCWDIPSFVHMFSKVDYLKGRMLQIAKDLSDKWNLKNDHPSKVGKRVPDETPILIDFRKNPHSKNVTELVIAGTSFNHTIMKQNQNENVTCQPKDIYFQIRYQSADGKVKAGMAILSYEEWLEIFADPDFMGFYKEVWNFCPLTAEYSERIEKYHNPTFINR